MKSLKIFACFVLFFTILTSCTNDDPLAKVKYQINGYDASVSQIKYAVLGGTVTTTDPDEFGNGSDTRKLDINILPFTAKLEVAVNNNTPTNKEYNLIIYVDGVAKASYDLDVPAMGAASGLVEYVVEANQ
ncbi:hypothetical protein [Flavobacterium sp.]